jgi:hypothetical protein
MLKVELKKIAEGCLQRHTTHIEKKIYNALFKLPKGEYVYNFPSLPIDENGIILTRYSYQKINIFNKFNFSIIQPLTPNDEELENAVLDNHIMEYMIDLDTSPKGLPFFGSHNCSIYPEIIKDIPVIYDTLYICDYYLKFIYRILLQYLVLDKTDDEVIFSNFLIAYKEINSQFAVSSIHNRPEFIEMIQVIKSFVDKYKDDPKIKESYQYTIGRQNGLDQQDILRIQITYKEILFYTDEEYLHFLPLVPNVEMTYGTDGEFPYYLSYVKQFVEEHYNDIKNAFSIYNRLENLHRLCAINRFKDLNTLESFDIDTPECKLVYTRRFPDNIMCCGGYVGKTNKAVKVSPESLGYGHASDRQLMDGSAPYVYKYLPHDSQTCITTKASYNAAHAAMYSPDSIVRAHPFSPIIQSLTMDMHEKSIEAECTPDPNLEKK